MKDFRNIALFVVLVGAVPLFTDSGSFRLAMLCFLALALMCRRLPKCSGA
jgi:uncharacterized membrane protein